MPWMIILFAISLHVPPDTAADGALAAIPCLSEAEAVRILGQPAQQTESAAHETADGVERFTCAYAATERDAQTKKTGVVYYLFEVYPDPAAAHQAYATIQADNTGLSGQRTLGGLGDEGWEHTDSENFYLVMVRVRHTILRIKVNKLTSYTSTDAVREVVRSLALRIAQ